MAITARDIAKACLGYVNLDLDTDTLPAGMRAQLVVAINDGLTQMRTEAKGAFRRSYGLEFPAPSTVSMTLGHSSKLVTMGTPLPQAGSTVLIPDDLGYNEIAPDIESNEHLLFSYA